MLLFPESVIKAAVDTFKEVAIDDFKSENYERAVKHLTVALSLDEKSHVLYSNRCTAYIALEQYERAMEDADECVRLQPTWAKGYLRRGSVYFRKGELERAERVLKEGLELDPGNDALKKELEAVMNAIAEKMARQRESLEAKERAIEAFNEQNYRGAVDLLKKAIKLDPENHIFYSNRAAAYMALEQYDRALGDADECIRLQPEWAKGYSRRGAALFRMDKLVDARDAFEKVRPSPHRSPRRPHQRSPRRPHQRWPRRPHQPPSARVHRRAPASHAPPPIYLRGSSSRRTTRRTCAARSRSCSSWSTLWRSGRRRASSSRSARSRRSTCRTSSAPSST